MLAVAPLGLVEAVTAVLREADPLVVRTANEHAFDEATAVMLALTHLGGTAGVLAICALAAIALAWLRLGYAVLALLVSVAATQAVVATLKGVVERPRPVSPDALVEAAGYAFPSGHAATAVALYGTLALIASAHLRGRASLAVLAGGLGLALAIGVTRVYLGAHYPSDVLAGWAVGAVIVAGVWRLVSLVRPPMVRTR
jgi:undecaprenyl-diphosphatase